MVNVRRGISTWYARDALAPDGAASRRKLFRLRHLVVRSRLNHRAHERLRSPGVWQSRNRLGEAGSPAGTTGPDALADEVEPDGSDVYDGARLASAERSGMA